MEPDINEEIKEEEYELPDVENILKNPILLITSSFEKINNERLQEINNLLIEHEFFTKEWKKYLETPEWAEVSSVKLANQYIESLQKTIRLQNRIIRHCSETIDKMKEIVEKYYSVKETKIIRNEEDFRTANNIKTIESEERNKCKIYLERIEELLRNSENDYEESFVKKRILDNLKSRRNLNALSCKRNLISTIATLARIDMPPETGNKILKILFEIYNIYYEVFNKYPFLIEKGIEEKFFKMYNFRIPKK